MYFIYFIKVAENIKIGICKATLKNLKQRLSEANRWSPNSKILGVTKTERKEDEKRLHIYFKKHQVANEVFVYHTDIVRFIKKYCGWTTSKRFISHSWRTLKSKKMKGDADNLARYRKKVQKSEEISWQEWAKYHESWRSINMKFVQMIEEGEIIEKRYYNYEMGHYYEYFIDGEEIQDTHDFTCQMWRKEYGEKFKDLSYSWGKLSDEVSYISLRTDIDDEDDFTGIGDDGLYYVDGKFCITDPLGIESY